MFQIHIGLADFCCSEAEARVKPTAGPKSPSGRTPRTLGGAGGGGRGAELPAVQYIYPRLGFTPLLSCKPPYGVVTQTLDNSEKCCWLTLVVFPLRIGGVFHVKSCVSAVIDLTYFIV